MSQTIKELLEYHRVELGRAFLNIGTDTSQVITEQVLAWLEAFLPAGADRRAEEVKKLIQTVTRQMGTGEGKAAAVIDHLTHLFDDTPEATTRRAV